MAYTIKNVAKETLEVGSRKGNDQKEIGRRTKMCKKNLSKAIVDIKELMICKDQRG